MNSRLKTNESKINLWLVRTLSKIKKITWFVQSVDIFVNLLNRL